MTSWGSLDMTWKEYAAELAERLHRDAGHRAADFMSCRDDECARRAASFRAGEPRALIDSGLRPPYINPATRCGYGWF